MSDGVITSFYRWEECTDKDIGAVWGIKTWGGKQINRLRLYVQDVAVAWRDEDDGKDIIVFYLPCNPTSLMIATINNVLASFGIDGKIINSNTKYILNLTGAGYTIEPGRENLTPGRSYICHMDIGCIKYGGGM